MAVTPPVFLLRLICRPSSSSEDVKSESEFAAGGGETALFRMVDFDLVALFLNVAVGTSATECGSSMDSYRRAQGALLRLRS